MWSLYFNDLKLFDTLWQYIEETEELAMNALMDNKHILDLVARELLEKSRITGLVSYALYFCFFVLLKLEEVVRWL